jgi:hypothetical protein
MNENEETPTQATTTEAAPVAAVPVTAAAPAKTPRLWSANTVIAGGIATVLFSGLVGGFLGAWIDDDGRGDFMRQGVMMQDGSGYGQYDGPGMMQDGQGYNGPGYMMGR